LPIFDKIATLATNRPSMQIFRNILFYISTFILSTLPTSSVVEGVVGQPQSFFPTEAQSQTDKTISHLIYRGLFYYDSEGALQGDLAAEWNSSEDNLSYTIKIEEGQKWSNGVEITSDDLIYTAFKLPELTGVATDKIDRYTVRYTLPNAFSPFLSLLTAGVMPVDAEEQQNPLRPISSADFRVISIKRDGPAVRKVVLYNTNPKASIKKLVFRYYSGDRDLLTAAALGDVDTFATSEIVDLDRFKAKKIPLKGVYYSLFFNLRDEKLQDATLRERLASVLDVEELVDNQGTPVEGPLSGNPFLDDSLDFDLYQESTASEFLDTSLEIVVPDTRKQRELAEKVEQSWEEGLGLDVNVLALNPDDIAELIIPSRNFEVLLYGQQVGRDPDRYINWHSTQADHPGLNLAGVDNVRIDISLEEGRNTVDPDERFTHYEDFQSNLMEQLPAVFLYHPYMNYYVSQNISGVSEEEVFDPWDRFDNFYEWERVFLN
jgi:peptide/nickel transport system substrate-binding protein